MRRRALILIGLLFVVARCAPSPSEPPAVPANAIAAGTPVGTASVAGRVTYAGTAPAPEPIRTDSDAACKRHQDGQPTRENLLVGPDGGLRYAYVHVVSGLGDRVFAPPKEPVTLDQRGCTYRPHMVGVMVGQPLRLLNSDSTLHNVHTVSTQNRPFNFGLPVEGQESTRVFTRPEVMVKAKCDVHPWMAAYIGVSDHPFFQVTGPDGAFALKGLPAGTYEIEVWHETLGARRQNVTLADGQSLSLDIVYPETGAGR